jgi:hypothetical protein
MCEHGLTDRTPSGKCRICNAITQKAYAERKRAETGKQMRVRRECPHDDPPKGRSGTCLLCKAARQREYRLRDRVSEAVVAQPAQNRQAKRAPALVPPRDPFPVVSYYPPNKRVANAADSAIKPGSLLEVLLSCWNLDRTFSRQAAKDVRQWEKENAGKKFSRFVPVDA